MALTPNEPRRSVSKRESILRSNNMESASPADAELFWRRYNEGRRRLQWKALKVGDVAQRWLKKEIAVAGTAVGRLKRIWSGVVPPECRSRCGVEGFARGTLRILVDAKSTAFVLKRRCEAVFLDTVKRDAPELKITRIAYRIGARS